jgi:two-component system OmpR family response regulator
MFEALDSSIVYSWSDLARPAVTKDNGSLPITHCFRAGASPLGGSMVLTRTPSANPRPILLVEDEQEFADQVRSELERIGYPVRLASMSEVVRAARQGDASLLILDRPISGVDCLPSLELLRSENVKVPVLVVSILSSVDEKVRGLKAGADDYLAKPFAMAELGARVEALLRRLGGARQTTLKVGDFEMDLIERTVFCAATKIDLGPREFKLLEYFLRRPGQMITRTMLLQDVWDHELSIESNVIDAHVTNLRKKIDLKNRPSRILNVRRVGYVLRPTAW